MRSNLQTGKSYLHLHLFIDVWIIVYDYSQYEPLLHLRNKRAAYFTFEHVPVIGLEAIVELHQ